MDEFSKVNAPWCVRIVSGWFALLTIALLVGGCLLNRTAPPDGLWEASVGLANLWSNWFDSGWISGCSLLIPDIGIIIVLMSGGATLMTCVGLRSVAVGLYVALGAVAVYVPLMGLAVTEGVCVYLAAISLMVVLPVVLLCRPASDRWFVARRECISNRLEGILRRECTCKWLVGILIVCALLHLVGILFPCL